MADYGSGLEVIDISDPTNPTLLGNYNTPGYVYAVTVSGDYAFLVDYDNGLYVIDISDPTTPTFLGNYDTPGGAWDVTVSGDNAFLVDYSYGFYVIDISNPTSPTQIGYYNTPGYAYGVTVSGDYAFVADGAAGLQVLNISDPTNPTLLGNYDTPGGAVDVTVSGDYAFVADNPYGLYVIDISDPTTPTLLGFYNTPGYANGVTVLGDYAFVANQHSLQIIDISDPANPLPLGICNSSAWKVAVSGDYAFVAGYGFGLLVARVFQYEVNFEARVGWSLIVDSSSDTIFRSRLTTTQTDSVQWELSADGDVNWQEIWPDAGWNKMNVPGTDLLWRSTLFWEDPGDTPFVTELQIEWLVAAGAIEKIVDVPDDQGGWVQTHFTRSGRDFPDETALAILNYGIWRRVDNTALIAALNSASSYLTPESAAVDTPDLNGIPFITYEGTKYVQSRVGVTASSFPPGTWAWVANVPAVQQDTYIAIIPTAADSSVFGTNHTVFVMTAHTTTPSIWYVSEPDSGYSLDNIAPAVPTGFTVAYNTGSGNELVWNECPDADFQYFRIYRSSDPDFIPTPSDLVFSTITTDWTDPDYDGWNVYYKVAALDFVGNESPPASAGTVTAATDPAIPQTYRLYPNVPNPFNPTTSIRYDVPAGGGMVTFRIYDVSGKLIQTVLDGPQTAGQQTVTWNGRDSQGRSVASGVYFYRLQAPGYEKTLKMVLVQ